MADSALAVGVALASLFTGVAGTKVAGVLVDLQAKARALREVVAGNEAFKAQAPAQAEAFKAAHAVQSPKTRQLVAAVRVEHANGSPSPGRA